MNIWTISATLLLTFYLLITEKISVDLTAIGLMVLLVVRKILTQTEAISGFGNPAVVTVGAMFVLAKLGVPIAPVLSVWRYKGIPGMKI